MIMLHPGIFCLRIDSNRINPDVGEQPDEAIELTSLCTRFSTLISPLAGDAGKY